MCALGQREMREREGGRVRSTCKEREDVFMSLWTKKSNSKSHKKQRTRGPTLALSANLCLCQNRRGIKTAGRRQSCALWMLLLLRILRLQTCTSEILYSAMQFFPKPIEILNLRS